MKCIILTMNDLAQLQNGKEFLLSSIETIDKDKFCKEYHYQYEPEGKIAVIVVSNVSVIDGLVERLRSD